MAGRSLSLFPRPACDYVLLFQCNVKWEKASKRRQTSAIFIEIRSMTEVKVLENESYCDTINVRCEEQ